MNQKQSLLHVMLLSILDNQVIDVQVAHGQTQHIQQVMTYLLLYISLKISMKNEFYQEMDAMSHIIKG